MDETSVDMDALLKAFQVYWRENPIEKSKLYQTIWTS
jgi:hypothetical protein